MTGDFSSRYGGCKFDIAYETSGEGTALFLLPTFSTVSSHEEMAPLASLLSQRFRTITPDWPGFGAAKRPALTYEPTLFDAFLESFVDAVSEALRSIRE